VSTGVAGRLRGARTHRLIRQLHLWIGAWGAIAAILFGVSGFIQNHRGVMQLPQGDSAEVSKVELEVPESARASRDAIREWLRDAQHIEVEDQRGPGRGGESGSRGAESAVGGGESGSGSGATGRNGYGARAAVRPGSWGSEAKRQGPRQSARWMFAGGNARITTQVDYVPGSSTVTIRKTHQSPLAVLERLHKGVGGGIAWILLGDSFALAMVALGISGLIMWARGRSSRQMAFSIVGAGVVVLLVIGGIAVV
jgi:uncharacterized protein